VSSGVKPSDIPDDSGKLKESCAKDERKKKSVEKEHPVTV
jgi:hypothetical protein